MVVIIPNKIFSTANKVSRDCEIQPNNLRIESNLNAWNIASSKPMNSQLNVARVATLEKANKSLNCKGDRWRTSYLEKTSREGCFIVATKLRTSDYGRN